MSNSFFDHLSKYLTSIGISPIYFYTLVLVPPLIYFLWSNRRELRKWDEQSAAKKISFVNAFAVVIGLLLACVLTLSGIWHD